MAEDGARQPTGPRHASKGGAPLPAPHLARMGRKSRSVRARTRPDGATLRVLRLLPSNDCPEQTSGCRPASLRSHRWPSVRGKDRTTEARCARRVRGSRARGRTTRTSSGGRSSRRPAPRSSGRSSTAFSPIISTPSRGERRERAHARQDRAHRPHRASLEPAVVPGRGDLLGPVHARTCARHARCGTRHGLIDPGGFRAGVLRACAPRCNAASAPSSFQARRAQRDV